MVILAAFWHCTKSHRAGHLFWPRGWTQVSWLRWKALSTVTPSLNTAAAHHGPQNGPSTP